MSSDNTFPEFSLKMFVTSTRQYFNSGDGIILGYVMTTGWNSFVPCSTLQILWSACGQQTCGHVSTIVETATQSKKRHKIQAIWKGIWDQQY